MKKYKIEGFTKEEKEDIVKRYGEWMKPENAVWVEKQYRKSLSDKSYEFVADGFIEINKKLKSICKKLCTKDMGIGKIKGLSNAFFTLY